MFGAGFGWGPGWGSGWGLNPWMGGPGWGWGHRGGFGFGGFAAPFLLGFLIGESAFFGW